MNPENPSKPAAPTSASAPGDAPVDAATVRYQVADLDRAIAFYTERLGFRLDHKAGSAFAAVSRKSLRLILSGPGSSGARPMPDGRAQAPGGWNRIVLYVDDLTAEIKKLEAAKVHFRNQVEVGPGGSQIMLEDPDENPIELHQPPSSPPEGDRPPPPR
jgi:glyoxylase I family protein